MPELPPIPHVGPFTAGIVAAMVMVLPAVVSATFAPACSVTLSRKLLIPFTASFGAIFAPVTALAASAALLIEPLATLPATVANTA